MRIVQIIPTLDRAGAEKQLVYLARGLKTRGIDVHVCVLTRDGPYGQELKKAGIPVTLIGKKGKIDLSALGRLQQILARLRPDIVQTWLFAANVYGRIAARRAGVPHVLACERCVDLWKSWWHFWIDRRLARITDRIIVNSSGVQEFYSQHGIPAEKITVIPNGVVLPEIGERSRQAVLAELGLPQDAQLIGLVGRLWPQKGVRDAIWAADLLKRIRDNVHLLIIGDGPEREALIRYRDSIEIQDRVHFLGHRDDVLSLMPHFDVLWNTSRYEGQSNAILEGMAWKVPVVASDIPGNRDLVVHEVTGFLVPLGPHLRAGVARATKKLLENPDLARRLGEAGHQRVATEFSVERMISAYEKLYRELLTAS
ncbi:MAG: glycosyltransferase family 4 protein [Thermogutta sp.]